MEEINLNILERDNPVLRQIAKPVAKTEIGSTKINAVLKTMSLAMHSQKDGVAIAAPQIGESLQIFMISGSLLKEADPKYKGEEKDLIFINPKIIKASKEKKEVEEGCLSVRWIYGKVRRSVRVTLEALDENGQKIERGASGLMAQIFQHETDHLNGVLFIDKARETWEMTEEEIAEVRGTR